MKNTLDWDVFCIAVGPELSIPSWGRVFTMWKQTGSKPQPVTITDVFSRINASRKTVEVDRLIRPFREKVQ